MSDVLRSRSFWTMIFKFIFDFVVLAIPELEPYKEALIASSTIIAGLVIGGFKGTDLLMARQGFSRYNSYTKAQ